MTNPSPTTADLVSCADAAINAYLAYKMILHSVDQTQARVDPATLAKAKRALAAAAMAIDDLTAAADDDAESAERGDCE